jgi:hypothetical protein
MTLTETTERRESLATLAPELKARRSPAQATQRYGYRADNAKVWRSCHWCGQLFIGRLLGSDACESGKCRAKSRNTDACDRTRTYLIVRAS